MLPVVLDVSILSMALVGGASQAVKRLKMLDNAGAKQVSVFCPKPERLSVEMATMAGDRLQMRLPEIDEIRDMAVIFVADISEENVRYIVTTARNCGTLVNVEDVKRQCDFHVPAILRRGAMLLSASTGGKSPVLARRLKSFLSLQFGEEWAEHVEEISTQRETWRKEGICFDALSQLSDEWIDKKGWFECLEMKKMTNL